jgi:signal transduction histidine kinase
MNVVVALPIIMHNRVIGVALLNRTPMDLMKVLYTKRSNIAGATVVIILLVLGISALTSFTITQPIHALIRQARLITAGQQDAAQPIPQPVTHEIALLSESLSEMARTIQHRSAYIRNFATSVSHEFKTPLTAIQGSVELLQEHWETMASEQRCRFLSNIGDDTDRLRRLVTRVLELARAETLDPVQGETCILPVLEALATRYRERGLQVSLPESSAFATLQVGLPVEILETVIVSLWDNSLQQGADHSKVSFLLDAGRLVIEVQDNGPGVSPANRAQIFTPFFTTQRDKGGTGLGLSITRQLLETYNAGIELGEKLPGATFRILLSGRPA